MSFNSRKLSQVAVANSGFSLWHYEGADDPPTAILEPGYFTSPYLRVNDRIMVVCAGEGGPSHMDVAVLTVNPTAVVKVAQSKPPKP